MKSWVFVVSGHRIEIIVSLSHYDVSHARTMSIDGKIVFARCTQLLEKVFQRLPQKIVLNMLRVSYQAF